jgi:putative Mg2+ transporter-C (MgtC) family protein
MNTPHIQADDWRTLAFRLVLALLAGGVIGWNRQVSGKPAGLRTHMLVSMGSALFVIVPLSVSASGEAISRTIQGVATGVGFLGAGDIVRQSLRDSGHEVPRNLASAAAIWVTAGLGIAAGYGLWQLTALGAVLTLITLTVVKKIEPASQRNEPGQR